MFWFFTLFVVISSLLATCSADQTCKIWRTSNFSLMTELSIKSNNPGETSRGWMWDCAFSGDSQYIVTGQYMSPGKWVITTTCEYTSSLKPFRNNSPSNMNTRNPKPINIFLFLEVKYWIRLLFKLQMCGEEFLSINNV